MLKEKLKYLKSKLKARNKDSFGNIDDKISNVVENIKAIDDKGENGSFKDGDMMRIKEFFQLFWKLSSNKESLLLQRSRLKWLQMGDSNSSFFHACVNKRLRGNTIHGLW